LGSKVDQLKMKTKILIIGGGLSGLYLASLLEKRGNDFLLLEARARVGGRILSVQDQTSATHVDMGPSWVWPGQPRIASLLQEHGLETFDQYSEGRLAYEDEAGKVSHEYNYSTMAGSLRVSGGLGRVTQAVFQKLPKDRVHLSHVVKYVKKNAMGYEVTGLNNAVEFSIQTEQVVLCLPPRVVEKTITFEPAFSSKVSQALVAVPTWMAGHAKVFAVYDKPFWRDMGLSGDGFSRRGPLMELHDASPHDGKVGALFGFVGTPVGSKHREEKTLISAVGEQLENMYGAQAKNPVDIIVKDWAIDKFTATSYDQNSGSHPVYGMPQALHALKEQGIYFSSTEMAPQFGGFIEGALEAAENTFNLLR